MNKKLVELIFFAFLFLPFAGCPSGSDKSNTFRGKLGEPCYLDGTCDSPLICVSDICTEDNTHSTCGNGVKEEGEECDQNDFGTAPSLCTNYGYLDGNVVCSADCKLSFVNCDAYLICGNGVKEEGEECDASDLGGLSSDCTEHGYLSGTVSCNDECLLDFSSCQTDPICGNDVIEGDEECDGSNFGGVSSNCGDHGFQPGGTVACNNECHFDYSACTPLSTCGDSIKNSSEECDGSDFGTSVPTCSDYGFYSGSILCSTACTVDPSGCSGECGDGVIQASYEECDISVGSASCNSIGYISGFLGCNSSCTFNVSNCERFRQWGTSGEERVTDALVDSSGNIYIYGDTTSSLYSTSYGGTDLFVSKFSSSGQFLWGWQFGGSGDDMAFSMAADSYGNIYLVGATYSSFDGYTSLGAHDAFIIKLSPSGSKTASRIYGTSLEDFAVAIAVDGASVYVGGATYGTLGTSSYGGGDILITKMDSNLNVQWHYQEGASANDFIWDLTVNGGTIYAAGDMHTDAYYTNGSGFVGAYSTSNGAQIWKHEIEAAAGARDDTSQIIYADGYIYAAGVTAGNLSGTSHGALDAYIIKYNTSGTQAWLKQYGTSTNDEAGGLLYKNGYIYINGTTLGAFSGTSAGGSDIYLLKINPADGSVTNTFQFGTSSDDWSGRNMNSYLNSLYIAGHTLSGFSSYPNQGGKDAFYTKFPDSLLGQ